MEIMKMMPAVKDYIWGGTALKEEYGIESELEKVAEGWMLSCHPNGNSTVASGEFAGMTLSELLTAHPEFVGLHAEDYDGFPVLVKLIDAKDDLSVQVHPDDDYASQEENSNGKTEMWYVVDCEEGAQLICGFSQELTAEEFRQAIVSGTLLDYVRRYPVHKGDVFLIEPGTLHAIGKGIIIAEIQQNSDITYRVFDYERTDAQGNKRELHIEKAIDVAITSPLIEEPGAAGEPEEVNGHTEQLLADCDYFTTVLVDVQGISMITVGKESFACVLMVDGNAQLSGLGSTVELNKGGCAFIPADFGKVRVSGNGKFLMTTI